MPHGTATGALMFAWFQRLLPQRGDFFGMFEAHAATLVGAANELQQLATDGASPHEMLERIHDQEHRADAIIREVLVTVRKTFLTPFDRGAITSLIGAMDDAIDEMLAAARAIDVYELRELRPEMKQIVEVLTLFTGRTVRDKTGLTGRYDFAMKLDLQMLLALAKKMGAPVPPAAANIPQSDGSSLMTALDEQLGLKLESTRDDVTVVVIDSVEAPLED